MELLPHAPGWVGLLRCPATGGDLQEAPDGWLQTADGEHRYPVIDGVPVLVAEHRGLLAAEHYLEQPARPRSRLRQRVQPTFWITRNVASAANSRELAQRLPPGSRVLIVG